MWNSFTPVYYELSNNAQVIQFRFPAQFDGAIYDSDEFRMYSFKIKRCPRLRSHDWTQCPFAHRGERAARRDPRRFNYCAVPCPDFRDIGTCFRGETCLFAHGVFEQWLHPEKYRTRLCSAGLDCQRQVCFFAHTIGELRAEVPPKLQFHHDIPQRLPEIPTKVPVKVMNDSQVCATSSGAAPPTFPDDVLSAFTGGDDFLASLSGVRVKENEKKSWELFGGFLVEQNLPSLGWVEEVMVE